MATLSKPQLSYMNSDFRLYPANYYARPALAPMAVGTNFGHVQRNLVEQYKYTLQQMAVSPFSVNDQNYMERIREEYGINDRKTYDLYGNIGGFLGAGAGVILSSGLINNPTKWFGLEKTGLLKWSKAKDGAAFFSGKYNPKVLAKRRARNVALAPKKDPLKYVLNNAVVKHAKEVKAYNTAVDVSAEATEALTKTTTKLAEANKAKEVAELKWASAKYTKNGSAVKVAAKEALEKTTKEAAEAAAELVTATNKAADAAKGMDAAATALKSADTVFNSVDAVKTGSKLSTKVSGFAPVVGIAADALSLGMSSYAMIDAMQKGDALGGVLFGISTLLDAVALVADFFGPVGDVVSVIAGAASAGVSGWYTGSTIGHSLSPSGLRAQANFMKNIQHSIIQRPVSFVGSLLAMGGVQMMANIGASRNSSWSHFWTGTAIGNLARSGVSMASMQAVNKMTSWVEEQIYDAPVDPSETNFTNVIGIIGDLNDNWYGATLKKSQLMALSNNNITTSDVFLESWGFNPNNKDDKIFNAVTFSQVREELGIDFKEAPILNSLIDVVGETLVDPQNYLEAYESQIRGAAKTNASEFVNVNINRASEVVRLKQAIELDKGNDMPIKYNPIEQPWEYLVSHEGLFRGDAKNRKRIVNQLVDSYLKEGEKGLRESLASLTVEKYKSSTFGPTFKKERPNAAENIQIIIKLFDDIFIQGNYKSLTYTKPHELLAYKEKLTMLYDEGSKIDPKHATEEEKTIKKRADDAMKRLTSYYGKQESETVLIEKFIEDLQVEVPNTTMRSMYAIHQDIQFYTDFADTVASGANWLFMPIQKLANIQNIRKALKVVATKTRFRNRLSNMSAKTLLEVSEVVENMNKHYTTADIKELTKNLDRDVTTLDELLKNKNEGKVDPLEYAEAKEINDRLSKEREVYLSEQERFNKYNEYTKKQDALYKEQEAMVFVGTKITYGGADDYIVVKDSAHAKKLLNEVLVYEKQLNGKTIAQYLKVHPNDMNAKKMYAQKIAAAEYFEYVLYYDIFKIANVQQQEVISLMSSLNMDIHNETTNLLKAHGQFIKYFNANVTRFKKDIALEFVEKYTVYLSELEKSVKEAEEELKNIEETLAKNKTDMDETEAKIERLKNKDRTVLLNIKLDELKGTQDALLKKRYEADHKLMDTRSTYTNVSSLREASQKTYEKIVNYENTRAELKSKGIKWNDKKHFDKETMEYNIEIETPVFNKLKRDEETKMLNEIQRILNKAGVTYKVSYMENGKMVEKIIEVSKGLHQLPVGASLQLQYKTTFTQALCGSIASAIGVDENSLDFALIKELKDAEGTDINFITWNSLGKDDQAEYILQLIANMNLTYDQQSMLERGSVRMIMKNMSKIATRGGVVTKQLSDVNEVILRKVVMYNLTKSNNSFKTRYEKIFVKLNDLQENIVKIHEDVSEREGLDADSKKQLSAVVDTHIERFNKVFKNLMSYKYIRDHVLQKVGTNPATTLFAATDELKGGTIPNYKSIKELEKEKFQRTDDLEDIIIDIVESDLFVKAYEEAQTSMQHVRTVQQLDILDKKETALIDNISLLQKEIKKDASEKSLEKLKLLEGELENVQAEYEKTINTIVNYRNEIKKREEQKIINTETGNKVKENVTKEVNKLVKKAKKYNIKGLKIVNGFDNITKIDNNPASKGIKKNKKDKKKQIVSELFGAKMYIRDYSQVSVEMKPTMYFESTTAEKPIGYYEVLKNAQRTSPGHDRHLRLFAEYLYYALKDSENKLKIDEDKLYNGAHLRIGLNLATEQGRQEYFIRKIMETYRRGGDKKIVLTHSDEKQQKNSTRIFKGIITKQLIAYAKEHNSDKVFIRYDRDEDGYLTMAAIKQLSTDLSKAEDTDTDLITVRDAVWKEATETFESIKVSSKYMLRKVLQRLDILHNYEKDDANSTRPAQWAVTQDVVSKIAYSNPELLNVLNAVIDYDGQKESNLFMFNVIQLIDSDLTENYADKEPFLVQDYDDIIVEKDSEGQNEVFFVKKDGTKISMFNAVFKQGATIKYLRRLFNKSSLSDDMKAIVELHYTEMINKYKGILNYSPIDLSKEMFIKSGGTEEEWEFIENNPDINQIYQTLTTMMNLKYTSELEDVETLTDKEKVARIDERIKNISKLYSKEMVVELYKHIDDTEGEYYEALKAVQLDDANNNSANAHIYKYAYLVLANKKIDNATKKLFINNILFYNAYVGKGNEYSSEKIGEYEARIEKLKSNTDEVSINEVIKLEKKIEKAKEVTKKLRYGFLEDKNKRAEYFIKNPQEVINFFGFYMDTDADNSKYKLAKTEENDYILIDEKYANVKKNGVPEINLSLYDVLHKRADESKLKKVKDQINKSDSVSVVFLNGGTEDERIVDIILGDNGNLVIVTKNVESTDKEGVTHKNANTALHKEFTLSRTALIAEINKSSGTRIKGIFTVSEEQLEYVKKTKNKMDLETEIEYTAVKNPETGEYYGETEQLVTTTSGKAIVPSFLSDIIKLDSSKDRLTKADGTKYETYDEMLTALLKYTKIYEQRVMLSEAYQTYTPFSASQTLADVQNTARSLKMYYTFMQLLADKGLDIPSANIDLITSKFYKTKLIKNDSLGKAPDLNTIEKYVDMETLAIFKEAGQLDIIIEALKEMQKQYGDSHIIVSSESILPEKFVDTLKTLKNVSIRLLRNLSAYSKQTQESIFKMLETKYDDGWKNGPQLEEFRDRLAFNNIWLQEAGFALGDKENPLRDPVRKQKEFKETIIKLIKFFESKEGMPARVMMKRAQEQNKEHTKVRKGFNNSLKKNKYKNKLDLSSFWNLYSRVGDGITRKKMEIVYEDPELRKVAEQLFKMIKDHTEGKKVLDEKQLQRIDNLFYAYDQAYFPSIKDSNEVYNLLINGYLSTYVNNIKDYIAPDEYDFYRMVDNYMAGGEEDVAKGKAMIEKLKEILQDKKRFDLNPEYRRRKRDFDDPKTTPLNRLERVKANYIANILEITDVEVDTKIREASEKLVDYLEGILFNVDTSNYMERTHILDKLLKKYAKQDKELPATLMEYYAQIDDIGEREAVERFINYIIFRRTSSNLTKEQIERAKERQKEGKKIDNEVVTDAYNILRNKGVTRSKVVHNTTEVWSYLNLTLMNDDHKFFNYFMNEYLTVGNEDALKANLRHFGIKGDTLIRALNNRTINGLFKTIRHNITPASMYAFTQVVNTAKMMYLGKESDGEKLTLIDAWYKQTRGPVRSAQQKIKEMNNLHGFSGNYDSNVIKQINDEMAVIFDTLTFTKVNNETLKHVLVSLDDQETTINNAVGTFVRQKENQITTEAKKIQRENYKVLFKPEKDMSLVSRQRYELTRTLNEAPLHSISEAVAEDINEVSSDNRIYNDIMHMFTDLAKEVMKDKLLAKNFIRTSSVTVALRTLKESKEHKLFAGVFETLISERMKEDDKVTQKKIDDQIALIIEYFRDSSILKELSDIEIKGVMGLLLHQQFRKDYKISLTSQDYKDYTEELNKAKYAVYMRKLGRISYRLSTAEDNNEIAQIIFGKSLIELEELAKKKDARATDAINSINLVKSLKTLIKSNVTLDPEYLYDVFVTAARTETVYYSEENAHTISFSHANSVWEGSKKTLESMEEKLTKTLKQFKLNLNEIQRASMLQDEKEASLAFTKNQIKIHEEELEGYKKLKKEETQEVYRQVIANHPELIQMYIKQNEEYIDKEVKKLKASKEEYELNFASKLRDIVEERQKVKDDLDKYKTTFEFQVYKETRKMSETKAIAYIRSKYATVLEEKRGIANKPAQIKAWLNETKETVKNFDKTIASYKKNKIQIKDTEGKIISKVYQVKSCTATYKKLIKAQEKWEDLEKKILIEEEDILADDELIEKIGKSFFNKLFENKETLGKKEYKNYLKKGEPSPLTKEQIDGTVEVLNKRIYSLERKIANKIDIINEREYIKGYKPNDEKNNAALEKDIKKLERLNKSKETLVASVNTISKSKPYTLKEVLQHSLDSYIKKNKLSFSTDLDDIIDYMAGEPTRELSTSIEQVTETLKKLDTDKNEIESDIKNLKEVVSLPEQIEKQRKLVEKNEQTKRSKEMAMNYKFEKHKTDRPHGNSNLGTYKNLMGVPRVDDLEEQDKSVINDIIETTTSASQYGSSYTKDELTELIEQYGPLDIHNPNIDVLTTRLNYMMQEGKTKDDEFFVFDMETINFEGNDIPYHITILHNQKGGKITIQNVYFNSQAFQRESNEDTPAITRFKDDTYRMYASRIEKHKSTDVIKYKLTTEEQVELRNKANVDAEEVIKKIKGTKNSTEFIRSFLSTFEYSNKHKVPIVTHAGERFDIPNYTAFLRKYANALLTNMYYSNVYDSNPSEIMKRYGVSSFAKLDELEDINVNEAILVEIDAKKLKLLERMRKNQEEGVYEEITDSEIKLLGELIQASQRVKIAKHIEDIELQLGIELDKEQKEKLFDPENSQTSEVKKLVYAWLDADEATRASLRAEILDRYRGGLQYLPNRTVGHNYMKDLEERIDKLLAEAAETYDDIKKNSTEIVYDLLGKSRRGKAIDTAMGVTENKVVYPAQEFIQNYLQEIDSLLSTRKMLKTLSPDTLNETIDKLDEEFNELDKRHNELTAAVKKLESSIDAVNKDADGYLNDMVEFARRVQDRTSKLLLKTKRAVSEANIYLHKRDKANNVNPLDEASLNYSIAKNIEEMNDISKGIEILIKISNELIKDSNTDVTKMFDRDTLGKFDLTWFDFEKDSDINNEKKRLTNEIERFEKLLKQIEPKTAQYKDLGKIKKNIDEVLNKIKKSQHIDAERAIVDYNKLARRYSLAELDINILERTDKKVELRNFSDKIIKDIEKQIADSGLNNNQFFAKNRDLETLLVMVDYNGRLERSISVLDMTETEKEKTFTTFKSIIIDGLKQSINNNQEKLKALRKLDIKSKGNISLALLDQKVKYLLDTVARSDLLYENQEGQSILNIVSNRSKSSDAMTDDEFKKTASSVMAKEYVDALGDPMATRRYNLATQNDDKYALMLKEDIVYYKPVLRDDGSMIFVFNFFDQNTQTLQQITLNSKSPKNLKTNFKYTYRYAYQPLVKPRTIELPSLQFVSKTDDNYGNIVTEFLNVSKTIDKFYKKYTNGVSGEDVYKVDGKDTSFESLKRALMFYKNSLSKALKNLPSDYGKLSDAKQAEELQKALKDILEKAVNSYDLPLEKLDDPNMTKRTEAMFLEHIKTTRLLTGRKGFRDSAGVYQAISDSLLSKYNAMVPGKVLNLIPPEFATDFTITYTDDSLAEKNIDLYNSSEGSMGTSFMKRTRYSTHLPFKHNTNSIRTGLSNTQQYKTYTSQGLINTLYLIEDDEFKDKKKPEDYDNDITRYISRLRPEDNDYNKRVVFMNNKILTTYDKLEEKDKENILLEYDEDTMNILDEILQKKHAFIPTVLSKEDKKRYLDDVIHKRGVNLKVTFTNDARGFEDTIVFDYDDAMALGWGKGYKTWLGLYGFKGAVKLERGVRAKYGTSLVASVKSVKDRGAYGALVDMFIASFKEAYYNKDLKKTDKFYSLVKEYNKQNSPLKKYVTFEDGFAIVKPNINYADFFNEKFFASFKTDSTWGRMSKIFDAYLSSNSKDTVVYKYNRNNKLINVETKVADGWQGTLYVTLDSEHITEKMANKADIRNYGGIAVAKVDHKGTVLNGVVFSESVLFPMLAKASGDDMNVFKAFYDEDDPMKIINNNELVQEYTKLSFRGIKHILEKAPVDDDGNILLNDLITLLTNQRYDSNIINWVREYVGYNYLWTKEKALDGSLAKEIELIKATLNKKIRQKAHDTMVGSRGVIRQSLFKKHVGGRQQLLANVENDRGTGITNKDIWENNIAHDPNWVQVGRYTDDEFKNKVLNKIQEIAPFDVDNKEIFSFKEIKNEAGETVKEYYITVNKKRTTEKEIELVLSRAGIINKPLKKQVDEHGNEIKVKHDMYDIIPRKRERVTFRITDQYKYGWMLSMRSPVQDFNAVSLIKIVGYHDHMALEADKYLYKRIGGDNDGDTLGLIAINANQYKYLKSLDATQESFYDIGYFDKVDKDYLMSEKKEESKEKEFVVTSEGNYTTIKRPDIKGIDVINSNAGKKFVSSYVDEKGDLVRIRETYTNSELYIQAFKNSDWILKSNEFIKMFPNIEKDFMNNTQTIRTYFNAYIRRHTGMYDTDNFSLNVYAKKESMLKIIEERKILENLLRRYAFDKALEEGKVKIEKYIKLSANDVYSMFYSLDDQDKVYMNKTYHLFDDKGKQNKAHRLHAFLEGTDETQRRIRKEIITNKVLSKLFQVTVTRVQGSKSGINFFGGNRKNQMVAVLFSRFAIVNRDAKSDFWKNIGAYQNNVITPSSMGSAIFTEEFFTRLTNTKENSLEDLLKEVSENVKTFKVKDKSTDKEVSLLEMMNKIFEKAKDGTKYTVIEKDVEDFLKEAATLVYNAYKYSELALDIFPKLSDVFNKHKKYTIKDFLEEDFIKELKLLPVVQELKDLEKETLEPWEAEWVKTQFFGANKDAANEFVNASEKGKSLEKLITSYSQGYINEVIITRKEFNELSDQASAIIGLAKHYGVDVQIYQYMSRYMSEVLEQTKKYRRRVTTLNPDTSYLNYTIAMDKDPFEDNKELEIVDKHYNDLLKDNKGKKDKKRATVNKDYLDKKFAINNLKAISRDNFDAQVFGRVGIHETIHTYVKEHVEKFVAVFDKYDVSDPVQLVKAAKEAEEYAKILVQFNVSGYIIKDYILKYVHDYNYINNQLRKSNKDIISFDEREDLIKNSTSLMEILLKVRNRYFQEDYDAKLKTEAPLVNTIIQSTLKIDQEFYEWDDEGNIVEIQGLTDIDTGVAHKDFLLEHISNAVLDKSSLPAVLNKKLSKQEYIMLQTLFEELDLNVSKQNLNFSETLEELLSDYNVLRSIYYSNKQTKEDLKKYKPKASPEDTKKSFINRETSYTLLKGDLKGLFVNRAQIIKAQQDLKNKQRELVRVNNDLREVSDRQQRINSLINKDTGALKNMLSIEEQIKAIDIKIKEYEEKIKNVNEHIKSYVFSEKFSELTPLLHTEDGSTIRNLYTYSKPTYLSINDIDDFHNSNLMSMHNRQSSFLATVDAFRINSSTGEPDWDAMYNWYVKRYDFARVTIITQPENEEGLLKTLSTEIFEEVENKKNKDKRKYKWAFKNLKEVQEFVERLKLGDPQKPIRFNGKDFSGISLDPKTLEFISGKTERFLTPTLKEINIKNGEDFKKLYELMMKDSTVQPLIGFTTINDIMDAYDQAYIMYKQTGLWSQQINKLLQFSKYLQRYSLGFIVRNWIDTWNQLWSEKQQEYGNIGALFKIPEIINVMKGMSEIKSVYKKVSLDRLLYLTAFKGHYEELKEIIKDRTTFSLTQQERIKEIVDINIKVLESYYSATLDSDEFSTRVAIKQQRAPLLINDLKKLRSDLDKNINTINSLSQLNHIKQSVEFIGSMKFAEYFVMYDKLADVFGKQPTYQSKNIRYIESIKNKDADKWDQFKEDLFELSAFMQTHAQRDEYQLQQSQIISQTLSVMLNPDKPSLTNYNDIAKQLDDELTAETGTFLQALKRTFVPWSKTGDINAMYNWLTADTETTGRIAGYFLDKYLHDLTFEQSVQKSLTRFFDYGSRSPLEMNYLADIPYLSFPIRSINNWIDRITDPRYVRYLSDLLDGIYGQFADDDGQYNEYVRYQMANGWIPIAGGFGLRAGNGAFDIMEILSNPVGQFEQRRSPLGRMITTIGDYLMSEEKENEKLMADVIRQSAVIGLATRGVNMLSALSPKAREKLADTKIARHMVDTRVPTKGVAQGVAKASSATYWYDNEFEKYTPKKYRYPNNGRYAYYENIYKDWFNKYGRMRKPKINPYSLVKDIQWKQYVRWQRYRYLMRSK